MSSTLNDLSKLFVKSPEKSPKMYYILIRRQKTAIPIPEFFSFSV